MKVSIVHIGRSRIILFFTAYWEMHKKYWFQLERSWGGGGTFLFCIQLCVRNALFSFTGGSAPMLPKELDCLQVTIYINHQILSPYTRILYFYLTFDLKYWPHIWPIQFGDTQYLMRLVQVYVVVNCILLNKLYINIITESSVNIRRTVVACSCYSFCLKSAVVYQIVSKRAFKGSVYEIQ